MSYEPFPKDQMGPQHHQPAYPATRKRWRTVLGIVLIAIGVLSIPGGLSGAMNSTDDIDAAYVVGVLIGMVLVVAIFVVPGILLLRRPRH